jgi:GMP synthase-like glutamine amidotransferase
VGRNPAKEIGWFPLAFTPEASRDRLFAGLERETVFHWHGETFALPEGAVRLAESALCANQAYRLGETAWGLQFHLEVTPAMIADWCLQDANCGDVHELTAPIDAGLHTERMITLSERVFGAWCDLLVRPQ